MKSIACRLGLFGLLLALAGQTLAVQTPPIVSVGDTPPDDLGRSRNGDEISIDGLVTHDWNDKYGFHPDRYLGIGGFLAKGAEALEQHRGAKPFATNSSWARRVTGKIRIENGELTDPRFEWEDLNW